MKKYAVILMILFSSATAYALYEFRGPLRNIKPGSWTKGRILYVSDTNDANSVLDLTEWIAGTANQIYATDDTDGSLTLNLPQDINTTSSPSFQALTTTGTISAGADTDINNVFGRWIMGYESTFGADAALLAHYDMFNSTDFALAQDNAGDTWLNSGRYTYLCSDGTYYARLYAAGGVTPTYHIIDGVTFAIGGALGSERVEITQSGTNPTILDVNTDYSNLLVNVNGVVAATDGNSTEWNLAYGWGDHSLGGYLTAETDPCWVAWLAVPPNVSVFTNDSGYLTGYSETDPCHVLWLAGPPNVSVFTNDAGYLAAYSETDPCAMPYLDQSVKIAASPTFAALTVDSPTLCVNLPSYTDKVGIGTATPSQALDLIGSLELEDTTTSTTGVIYKGGNRFLHNFHHPTGGGAVPDGYNTFVGVNAGNFTMGSTATSAWEASYNSAMGVYALFSNTTGYNNSAMGVYALLFNTTGYNNSAMGYAALYSNTTGYNNSAMGVNALFFNTTGYNNSAMGYAALHANTTGFYNSAMGYAALYYNQTGVQNTVVGSYAGQGVEGNSFSDNSLFGAYSGYLLTTGSSNIFLGYKSGYNQTTNSNLLIIDNQDRTSAALELTNSLIYGTFNAAPASQTLRVNAALQVSQGAQINGAFNFAADVNAVDDYKITLTPAPTAYTTGMMITFSAVTANTGACTLNANALGAKSLKALHDQDPPDNYIEAGSIVMAVYDAAGNFQMLQADANP